jgi:hypothetical protein
MATYQNNRKRVVSTINFENAEGNIPLSFKNLRLHSIEPSDFGNKRNGLPTRRFTAINMHNGDTIAVLVQCNLRDQVINAAVRASEGEIVTIKNVYGYRGQKGFANGMTTVFAKDLDLEFLTPEPLSTTPVDVPVNVPAELVAQAELAAAETSNTLQ